MFLYFFLVLSASLCCDYSLGFKLTLKYIPFRCYLQMRVAVKIMGFFCDFLVIQSNLWISIFCNLYRKYLQYWKLYLWILLYFIEKFQDVTKVLVVSLVKEKWEICNEKIFAAFLEICRDKIRKTSVWKPLRTCGKPV